MFQKTSELLLLIRWWSLMTFPRLLERGRSQYGYKNISAARTNEANSQCALLRVFSRAAFFPITLKSMSRMVPYVPATIINHWGSVLSHRGGVTCNSLVKVKMKPLSLQGASNSPTAILCNMSNYNKISAGKHLFQE